jgi:prepilin-type processing-associated H-X9-DG protein
MRRFLVRLFAIIGVLFVMACLGQAVPFEFAFYLIAGWAHFLYRVAPQVKLDTSATATAAVCLILLTIGLHQFASWLYPFMARSSAADCGESLRRWPARWTAWLITGVVLMFVAGLATVGVAHQTAWLLFSPEKLVNAAGARGAAWRAQSINNLKWIGLALHNYDEEHKSFPPGGTFDPNGRPLHGWQAAILPFSEQTDLYDRIDFRFPWNDVHNAVPYQTTVTFFLRPGIDRKKDAAGYALSHYAANGLMLGGSVPKTLRGVTDGTSNTIMAGEAVDNFRAWGDPTNWRDTSLGINRSPNGFGSPAPGGANFLFVDGSVHFLKNAIDPRILKALSTPAGGDPVNTDQY